MGQTFTVKDHAAKQPARADADCLPEDVDDNSSTSGHPPRLPSAALGDLVRAASSHDGPWPTVAIWHGDDDTTIRPGSAGDLARQWADVHGAVTMAADDRSDAGHRTDLWRAPGGLVAVERHLIAHMAHGVALMIGGADGCGTAGRHLLDVGVSSSGEIARGWGLSPTERPFIAASRAVASPASVAA